MSEQSLCGLCGLPMPEGEEMFNYHGECGHTLVQHCVVPSDGKKRGCAYEDCDCEDYQNPNGQPANSSTIAETS